MMTVMKKTASKRELSIRKEITHKRIVETAARAIRRSGYDGTGVADIMKEAGLTHGGFYAHFSSRNAMLAEAADQAGAETIATAEHVFAQVSQDHALQALMNAYLSNDHTANIETGCFFAALGSEMPRQAPEVRAASTRRIKEMVALIESRLSDGKSITGKQDLRAAALVMISTMVGTLLLARAVDDPELCDAFRQAALNHYAPKND
jgi:TetR/AcrR family transcriptional regulator, transcriptional repressor for nem operon